MGGCELIRKRFIDDRYTLKIFKIPHVLSLFFPIVIILIVNIQWATALLAQGTGSSLRFFGNGVNDIDRVKIAIDDPPRPADVGATDFTIEFWINASALENTAAAITCGANYNWIFGNTIIDRDRFGENRGYGVSIAGGMIAFGLICDNSIFPSTWTICGVTNVLNEQWHHVAVQRRRSDGWMWLYVDGQVEAQVDGPDGDISYPDGVVTSFPNDPFIVIGAEKHDAGPQFPSYSGGIDELRISNVLRYSTNFTSSLQPFIPDSNTVALYHFDEGTGDIINDVSGALGGPSHGVRRFGGDPPGPIWVTDTPLPVTLINISATAGDQEVLLNWRTQSELENLGFEIYRAINSDDNYQLHESYRTNNNLVGAGNSNVLRQYQFTDSYLINGKIYWYKIADVDFHGNRTFHGPVSAVPNSKKIPVEAQQSTGNRFWLKQNYPNPFNSGTSIQFEIQSENTDPKRIKLIIFDNMGRKVKHLLHDWLPPGIYETYWDGLSDHGLPIPSGTYFLELKSGYFSKIMKINLIK
jgi:hypothetical protein